MTLREQMEYINSGLDKLPPIQIRALPYARGFVMRGWGQTIAICFVLGVYSVVRLTLWALDWMRYWGWVQ